MRKLEIKDGGIMQIAVREEIHRSEESRYDHRLHGILLILSGYSCYDVAQLFGQSPRTVEYWVKRFERSGFAGLQEVDRPGRPRLLGGAERQKIGEDLRRSPRNWGYPQNLWDGKLLSHHIEKEFGVHLGVRQCQRLFHQMGFRLRKPRPLIANSDPFAKKRYKKNPSTRRS